MWKVFISYHSWIYRIFLHLNLYNCLRRAMNYAPWCVWRCSCAMSLIQKYVGVLWYFDHTLLRALQSARFRGYIHQTLQAAAVGDILQIKKKEPSFEVTSNSFYKSKFDVPESEIPEVRLRPVNINCALNLKHLGLVFGRGVQ